MSKRPRTNDDDDSSSATPIAKKRVASTSSITMHYLDENYCKQSDGDLVFLIENTLFKLPRFLVHKSCPNFETIFKRARAEDNVISLSDTLDDFRALCWALHAHPTDIIDQGKRSNIEFSRLVSIFIMTHKYQFAHYQEWSRHMLKKSLAIPRETPDANILTEYPTQDLKRLLIALAPCKCGCKNKALQKMVWQVWLRRLQESTTLSSKYALDCAESLGLRQFQGHIYYTKLLRMNAAAVPVTGTAAPAFSQKTDYTQAQSLCLHRGFWSLSQYWASLTAPPAHLRRPQSDHDTVCVDRWNRMWLRGIQHKVSANMTQTWDPLGSLRALISEENVVRNDGDATCGCHFRKEAQAIFNSMLLSLPDHFLGIEEKGNTLQMPSEK